MYCMSERGTYVSIHRGIKCVLVVGPLHGGGMAKSCAIGYVPGTILCTWCLVPGTWSARAALLHLIGPVLEMLLVSNHHVVF